MVDGRRVFCPIKYPQGAADVISINENKQVDISVDGTMTLIEQPMIEFEVRQVPDLGTEGWFTDPHETHNLRYFDGSRWTDHVTHFGPTPCQGCS